jgi:hypothetical protein
VAFGGYGTNGIWRGRRRRLRRQCGPLCDGRHCNHRRHRRHERARSSLGIRTARRKMETGRAETYGKRHFLRGERCSFRQRDDRPRRSAHHAHQTWGCLVLDIDLRPRGSPNPRLSAPRDIPRPPPGRAFEGYIHTSHCYSCRCHRLQYSRDGGPPRFDDLGSTETRRGRDSSLTLRRSGTDRRVMRPAPFPGEHERPRDSPDGRGARLSARRPSGRQRHVRLRTARIVDGHH